MTSRSYPISILSANNNSPSSSRSHRSRTPTAPKSSSPVISRTSSQTSQPRTASRGDIPAPRMAPTTPTTRKPRRKQGVASSDQRSKVEQEEAGASGVEGVASGDAKDLSSEDEELFGLLGVSSTPASKPSHPSLPEKSLEKGVLPITKKDINDSKRSAKKKAPASTSKPLPSAPGDPQAVPVSPTPKSRPKRNPRNTKPKEAADSESDATYSRALPLQDGAPASAQPAGAAKKGKNARGAKNNLRKEDLSASATFDVSSLSQSLPTEGFMAQAARLKKKTGKGQLTASEDEGTWDMPGAEDIAASGDLTWQQQLASYPHVDGKTPSKRKSTKSKGRGANNPSLLSSTNPHSATPTPPTSFSQPTRPGHVRRASADSIPSSKTRRSAPAAPAQPHAATIENMPFHTGFNVHRAPQTPAKYATGIVSDLPLQGEFPRLKQGNMGPMGGMPIPAAGVGKIKYAGPTFHNSPHASSIPRPDTDDF